MKHTQILLNCFLWLICFGNFYIDKISIGEFLILTSLSIIAHEILTSKKDE